MNMQVFDLTFKVMVLHVLSLIVVCFHDNEDGQVKLAILSMNGCIVNRTNKSIQLYFKAFNVPQ